MRVMTELAIPRQTTSRGLTSLPIEYMSTMDRPFIRGNYGKKWELGHRVNPNKPDKVYMDEHAVLARAGLLNVITFVALMNFFFKRDSIYVTTLSPIVSSRSKALRLILVVILMCSVFTWLESSCGFCFGCFVYNKSLVPMMHLEECAVCGRSHVENLEECAVCGRSHVEVKPVF